MKTFDFRTGTGGFVPDCSGYSLADNEWSDLNNVRIRNRAVSRIAGHTQPLGLDSEARYSVFLNGYSGNKYYYYIDSDGLTHRVGADDSETEVTKGVGGTKSPLETDDPNYLMAPFQGGYSLLVNDGHSTPQYITSVGTGTNTTELTDIPGWEYNSAYESVSCHVIRPFKYVMVAGGITQTLTSDNSIERNVGTVRVSNQAAPGSLPTWDPDASGADTADEFELSEYGSIVDFVALGDNLQIFTDDEIYSLRLTGNTTQPVVVAKQMSGRGMLATDCGVEFFGKLFVVGPEDIYLYQGGAGAQSVAEGRVRDYFRNDLSDDHYLNAFVRHNEQLNEIWVHYPDTNSTGACNKALIWNYTSNVWYPRDLQDVYAGSLGPAVSNEDFVLSDYKLMLPTTGGLLRMDDGDDFNGDPINWLMERKGHNLVPNQPNVSKWTNEVFINATGSGDFTVRQRATNNAGEEFEFDDNDAKIKESSFTLQDELSVGGITNGKFYNIQFSGTSDINLHSFTVMLKGSNQRTD